MNKRRLLLFSVFALLHITTSQRNFIDGSYGRCNHSSRYLSSNTDYLTCGPHRVQQLISVTQDPGSTQLKRRLRIGLIEPYSGGDEISKTFERHRNKILTTPSKDILERQNFRERIALYRPVLNNDIYRSKFSSSSSRYNNRINEVYTNRFEGRRVSGFNYNDRDVGSLNDRDTRNERKRDLLELVERKPKRHANTDSLRDYYNRDYDRYTERKVLPQKLELDRNAYRKANLQNIRKIITGKETTFNQFAANRFSEFNTYRNLGKQLSQNELRTTTSRDVVNKDKMNINYSKRVSNEISRRLLTRDVDYFNSLTENRKRHERVYNREINEVGRGTRDIKLELREASRFRDYVRTKRDEMSRIQNYRQNIDQFDVHRKREDINSHRRTSSEERYTARHISIDTKIQFDRKYDNYNVRYNRDMKERLILQDNNDKERRVNDNRESINFEETNRRVNIFDSRNNNDPRKFQRNWLSVRRSFIGRSLESDNERSTRDNLSMAHSQGRDQIRGSRKIRRNIDMSSDKILRRNRLTYSLVSKLSGTDETRRKLAYSRFLNENVIFGRRQPANRRDQNYDKILDIGNVRRSLGKQRRLREDENRMTTRKNIHVITSRRSILIDGTSTENVNYERSRSVRNRERSINNRLLTRKVDDERRKTKQSQEDRSFNTRRLDTINENRYSVTDFYGSESSRTHKTHYGSNVFEIKLQYLFYALQFAYLLSVLMQIPKINEKNKQRNRILAWLTPAEYIKID